MGYYATANGFITIPSDNLDKLFLVARMMLNDKENMSGGSNSEKWYAWVDSNKVSEKCKNKDLSGLFLCWGFYIEPTYVLDQFSISFDNKICDERIFLNKIAPFVTRGEIVWVGEDNSKWKQEFKNGQMRVLKGRTVWE